MLGYFSLSDKPKQNLMGTHIVLDSGCMSTTEVNLVLLQEYLEDKHMSTFFGCLLPIWGTHLALRELQDHGNVTQETGE